MDELLTHFANGLVVVSVALVLGITLMGVRGFNQWSAGDPGSRNSFRIAGNLLGGLIPLLGVLYFASQPQRRADQAIEAAAAEAEASEDRREQLATMCSDALTPVEGEVASEIYGYYSGGSETEQADGSILVRVERTSRVKIDTSCPQKFAGSCSIRDGSVTVLEQLKPDGFEPC